MSQTKSWFVTIIAALIFFYVYVQITIFNSISSNIMEDFHFTAAQLGSLSSYYFVGNILLLLPAGILLDRLSPKWLIVIATALCSLGAFIFCSSHTYTVAAFSRLLVGIGGTFCFLAPVKIATRWFPANKLAMVTGFIVMMAMFGAMVAQTPVVILVGKYGWRATMNFTVIVGFVFTVLMALCVKDYPEENKKTILQEKQNLSTAGFWHSLFLVVKNKQNWLSGLSISLLNLPIFLLGAMWGSLYLSQASGFSLTTASSIVSVLFIGNIIGSPFFGWLSSLLDQRKSIMIFGAIALALVSSALIFFPHMNIAMMYIAFFLCGFISGTQVLGYPLITAHNPRELSGTALSIGSLVIMSGGFTQALFGWLLGLNWNHAMIHGSPLYAISDFQIGLALMPVCCLITIIALAFCKEIDKK